MRANGKSKYLMVVLMAAVFHFGVSVASASGCHPIFYHLAKWTVGGVIWKVEAGDPVTIHDGFLGRQLSPVMGDFGRSSEGSPTESSVSVVASTKLRQRLFSNLKEWRPFVVTRNGVRVTRAFFHFMVEGPYHLAVDLPLGIGSEKAFGTRLRTGYLTKAAVYSALFAFLLNALDEQEKKKIELSAEVHSAELDRMIEEDFRLFPIRIALGNGDLTQKEARLRARYLQLSFRHYYEYMDREYAKRSLKDSDSDVQPYLEGLGVLPSGFVFSQLNAEQQRRVIDLNHLYLAELRLLDGITGVSPEGAFLFREKSLDSEMLLKTIQDPQDAFTQGLLKLYTEGHQKKTITFSTLKRFLMHEAWIRAVEYSELAVGNDPYQIGFELRKEALIELRGMQIAQP